MNWNQRTVKIEYKKFKDIVAGDIVVVYILKYRTPVLCEVVDNVKNMLEFSNGQLVLFNENNDFISITISMILYSCIQSYEKVHSPRNYMELLSTENLVDVTNRMESAL